MAEQKVLTITVTCKARACQAQNHFALAPEPAFLISTLYCLAGVNVKKLDLKVGKA